MCDKLFVKFIRFGEFAINPSPFFDRIRDTDEKLVLKRHRDEWYQVKKIKEPLDTIKSPKDNKSIDIKD